MAVAKSAMGNYEEAACAAFEGLEIDEHNDELKSFMQKCINQGRKEHLAKTKREGGDDGRESVMAAVI